MELAENPVATTWAVTEHRNRAGIPKGGHFGRRTAGLDPRTAGSHLRFLTVEGPAFTDFRTRSPESRHNYHQPLAEIMWMFKTPDVAHKQPGEEASNRQSLLSQPFRKVVAAIGKHLNGGSVSVSA
jgi:hypothetical protein